MLNCNRRKAYICETLIMNFPVGVKFRLDEGDPDEGVWSEFSMASWLSAHVGWAIPIPPGHAGKQAPKGVMQDIHVISNSDVS